MANVSAKQGEEFQGLAFLYVLLGWALVGAVIYLAFGFFGYHNFQLLDTGKTVSGQLYARVNQLFKYADAWNWLLLTLLVCVWIIIFSVNDFLLRSYQGRLKIGSKKKSFYERGIIWSARLVTNMVLTVIQFVLFCNLINLFVASPYIRQPAELSPARKDVLVLGTSKFLQGSTNSNIYYSQRIDCAIDLYKRGLVNSFILSGDVNKGIDYNEPRDMGHDLIQAGVSPGRIQYDYHGHRTFDSILRFAANSKQDTVLIVSQDFHLQRALYLARQIGVNAIGVRAEGGLTASMMKRELFAKAKVLLDVYIFNTQAYGYSSGSRRSISILNKTDLVLISFVTLMIVLAAMMTRRILYF